MKRYLWLIFVFSFPFIAQGYTFSRTLRLGMSGDDVKDLQIVLNSDPTTVVAQSGPGSSGEESGYFGVLTEKAVEKFQQKYAPEVLFPSGIYQSTGVAGVYTRKKLNALSTPTSAIPAAIPSADVASSSVPVLPSASYDFSQFFSLKPQIFNLSRYQTKPGSSVVINGSGFLDHDNTVFIGPQYHVDHLSSPDGRSITVSIPPTISEGSYNLWVENKNGSTYDSTFGDYFTLSSDPSDPPVILAVHPSSVSFGGAASITLTGTGFQKAGNNIYTSIGNITNASSDGTSITFLLSDLSRYTALAAGAKNMKGRSVLITITMQNSAGVTRIPASFLIQF